MKLDSEQLERRGGVFRARWLFPGDGPPVGDGVLEIDESGVIVAIRQGADCDAVDLGNTAIIPALVNPHTHLEFSNLSAPVAPAQPFPQWIANVIAIRAKRDVPIEQVIARGIAQSLNAGSFALGEIAHPSSQSAYQNQDDRVTLRVFYELIGPCADTWEKQLSAAKAQLVECRASDSRIRGGLSPHAPYTVPQDLFEGTVALAADFQVPVAVHLAETASERDLLAEGRGELVDMMRGLGLWEASLHPLGRTFSDWIRLLSQAPRGLVVHGNYLNDGELDEIARFTQLTLVYCPRTHAYFGHPPHPFQRLLDRGGRVALGTDSLGSNPDLSLWNEAIFVSRGNPDLSSDTILKMVTHWPAEALGIADVAGSLAVGREANFLAVAVTEEAGRPVLFRPDHQRPRVFHRGIEVVECLH